MVYLVVCFAVAVALWAALELLAVAGFLGVLSGERFERCAQCHRIGLTFGGCRHAAGCPHTALVPVHVESWHVRAHRPQGS